MFGRGVKNLLDIAKDDPKSLAATVMEDHENPVFTYTAPEDSGSGRISIFLDPVSESWSPSILSEHGGPHPYPDALVAPNAGLSSYPAWRPVIVWALTHNVPFAVTEYAEQSCEVQRTAFRELLACEMHMPGSIYGCVRGAPTREMCVRALSRAQGEENFAIAVNPFQRPGQRPVPTRLPNVPNGFTMVVVPFHARDGDRDGEQKAGESVDDGKNTGYAASLEELD